MLTITVFEPKDDSFKAQLGALYFTIQQVKDDDVYIFDFSNLSFAYPLLVLPLAAYIHDTKSRFIPPHKKDVKDYFETIKFPEGVRSVSDMQKTKQYLPISLLTGQSSITDKEELETCFEQLLFKAAGSIQGTKNALFYPIMEFVANILEHSKRSEGWLFAQIYTNKGFLDICIVDRGRGIKQSYTDDLKLTLSDEDAINEAMKGNSTKSDKERGFGLHTSQEMVCEAMNGCFAIISGNAALFAENTSKKIATMTNFHWQGVIIGYRIPIPTHEIDITPYIE